MKGSSKRGTDGRTRGEAGHGSQSAQQQQHGVVTMTRDSDYSPPHEVKQHGSVWLDIIQACVVCKEGDVHSRR